MHFLVLVVVPSDIQDIHGKVNELLAPYSTRLEVEPHKGYFDNKELHFWAKELRVKKNDLQELAKRLECVGYETGVDERGLYWWSTWNQREKYDYWMYSVSGFNRNLYSDGGVKAALEPHQEAIQQTEYLAYNICPAAFLPEEMLTFALVTPDGSWHDARDYGYGIDRVRNADSLHVWRVQFHGLLRQYQEYLAVLVNCHR